MERTLLQKFRFLSPTHRPEPTLWTVWCKCSAPWCKAGSERGRGAWSSLPSRGPRAPDPSAARAALGSGVTIARVPTRVKHGRSELTPESKRSPDTVSGFYIYLLSFWVICLLRTRAQGGSLTIVSLWDESRSDGLAPAPFISALLPEVGRLLGNSRFRGFLTGWGAGPRCC